MSCGGGNGKHITITNTFVQKVRMQALECLSGFVTLPYYKVFPYQRKVINELGASLDDKKRIVRKAASGCRNKW